MQPPRVNILGVGVHATNMREAVSLIEGWIREKDQHYVCATSVHGVMESQKHPDLREVFNASGLTTADGMPLVWLSRLAGYGSAERVYGPDLLLALSERLAEKGYSAYFYGGMPGIAEKVAKTLQSRYPGLRIAGTFSPPFGPVTPGEDARIVDMINRANPDVLWIGISTPKQDRWIAAHIGRVKAPVLIGVGAAFDFHSGTKAQAPLWMQRNGLEWLFRLCSEPGRLWKRYLLCCSGFIVLALLQLLGLKKYARP